MEEKLTEITLEIAATRPAMTRLGLPLYLVVAFGFAAAMLIIFQLFLWNVVLVPLWWLARLGLSRDYNGPRIAALWLRTSASDMTAHIWGGASPSPFPAGTSWRGRGIDA